MTVISQLKKSLVKGQKTIVFLSVATLGGTLIRLILSKTTNLNEIGYCLLYLVFSIIDCIPLATYLNGPILKLIFDREIC